MSSVILARKKRLQKRLIASGIIAIIFLSAGGALTVAGISYFSAQEARRTGLDSEIANMGGQTAQMRNDAQESKSAVKLYSLITSNGSGVDFSLSRELLTERLGQMRNKYHFAKLDLNASAVREVENSALQLKLGKEINMQVELQLQAVSDVYIAAFLNDLMVQLPGYVELQHVNIRKDSELTSDTLLLVAQNPAALPTNTSAVIKFLWHGIKPNPPEQVAGTPAPLAGGPVP